MIFRLRSSKIHGIGVYSTEKIKKGTFLPLFEDDDSRFIKIDSLKKNDVMTSIVKNYGIYDEKRKGYYVAKNFNRMSIGWFLNHSDNPNAYHNNYYYYAKRDIKKNEEITIDYEEL